MQIELFTWDEIKAKIDESTEYVYDHADDDQVNQRLIVVKQSTNIEYFYRMPIIDIPVPGSDQKDYDDNYAAGVSRGLADPINVDITAALDELPLHVTFALPKELPHGATAISQNDLSFIDKRLAKQFGSDEKTWKIPNGKYVTIQRLEFGGYVDKAGIDKPIVTKAELWYQPNGNTVGQELITFIYLHHMSGDFRDPYKEYGPGDNTARFRLYLRNRSDERIECNAVVTGYSK